MYNVGIPKLSDFKPQTKNANKHSQRGRGLLDMSMRRDGYTAPMIAAKDGELFIGSHRLEVSADVFTPEVEPIIVHSDGTRPVVVVRDDIETANDPKAKRLGLADNRIAELSLEWDVPTLMSFELDDLDIVGFNEQERIDFGIQEKPSADAEPQTDRAAELLEKWGVKTGDLWAIGEHRLICGDCTDPAVVERVMGGEKAGACVTDIPYEVTPKEWEGMPEFEQKDLSAFQSIHVHFRTQEDIDIFAELIGQKIGEKTRALWYPEADKINMKDYYVSES